MSTATNGSGVRYEECEGNPTTAELCQGVTKEYYYSASSLSSDPSNMTCSNCQKTGGCYSYCGDGTKDGSLDEYTNILVALDLDKGSGSTTANTGTLLGTPAVTGGSWTSSGKHGKAYTFNGGGYITSTSSLEYESDYHNNFTMMAWVNPTATTKVDYSQTNSGTSMANSSNNFIFGAVRGTGADPHHYDGGTGAGVSVGTNGIVVGTHAASYMPPLAVYSGTISGWHHVAVVFENKTPKIYLDGTLVKTGLQADKQWVFPSNEVGGGSASFGNFKGTLDDVRIIGKSLNETQIKAFMDQSGAESCDSGSGNSDSWSQNKHCNAHCTGYAPYCGDGEKNGDETCDKNDGVSGYCYVQRSSSCSASCGSYTCYDVYAYTCNSTCTNNKVKSSTATATKLDSDERDEYTSTQCQ